jgi:Asp-tRNA(Asn)/Glu-tRNA(Gln) amidotransferase A subunit family amidase
MVPVSIGTQVGGSVIRPSSFCANWALKPTYGALNRGERQGYSQSHIGVHAGCAEDMWQVAIEVARRAGGDPGHPGLFGPDEPPTPLRPQRIVVIETEGWTRLDSGSRNAFERLLELLRAQGVALVRRGDSPLVEAFEQSIVGATALTRDICAYEVRWSLENTAEQQPGGLSRRALAQLAHARSLSLDDFRQRLQARDDIRRRMAQLAPLGDALITLSSLGPAPLADPEGPRPTGDAAFNYPASLLGAPAVSVPMLAVGGMPLGVQLIGQPHADARVTGVARWISQAVPAVSVDYARGSQ